MQLNVDSLQPAEGTVQAQVHLQSILDAATEVSIIVTDRDGLITLFGRGAEKLLGYQAAEMVGLRTPLILHDPSEIEVRSNELSALHGRSIQGFETIVALAEIQGAESREWTYIRKDGLRLTVELSVTTQRDPNGVILGYVGTAIDVTNRKAMENTWRTTSTFLDGLSRQARVGGWKLDVVTGKLTWSDSLYELYEVPNRIPSTIEDCHVFYAPEHRLLLEKAIQECLRSRCSWVVELPMRTGKGNMRWVRNHGEAIVDDNQVVKLYCCIQDITKQRQASEELGRRAAELELMRNAADAACRAKSEFLANMSHEIRNPLTAILGYAEMLRDETDLMASLAYRNRILDTLANAGQHLLTVINDILDLSKIEAERMTVESIETNLPDLLNEVERIMRTRTNEKGLVLKTRFTTAVPDRILSDPTRFRQIMINLVGNAAKFTSCGHIIIEASVPLDVHPSIIRIDVQDTGKGMTHEQTLGLFELFSQADTTVTRQYGGTGLGLTICWTNPGQGSCFRVELPLRTVSNTKFVDEPSSAKQRAHPVIACKLNGRILLVEDGQDNQRIISHILRKAGAILGIAEHGGIAMKMLSDAKGRNETYDLILSDMQMPVVDGYTLARTLRAKGCQIPIIALTALAMAGDREKCLAAGCNDYTTKPIDKVDLLATCSRWLQDAHGPVCTLSHVSGDIASPVVSL
jgi:PAS domain S-box-containing protein